MTGTKKEDEIPEETFRRDYGGKQIANEMQEEARSVSVNELFKVVFVLPLILVVGLLVLRTVDLTWSGVAVVVATEIVLLGWLGFTKYRFLGHRRSR